VLEAEGGDYDGSQPWDPNPTHDGITQTEYDRHRAANEQPPQSVFQMSDAERDAIYMTDYWVPSHADALAWPMSLFQFDFYVNTAPHRAIATLQRTINRTTGLHVDVDGAWGPQTESAVRQGFPLPAGPLTLLIERLLEYEDIVKHDPVKVTPLWKEWIPRVANLYRRFT